jgi:Mg-chelatase subunit ChlD
VEEASKHIDTMEATYGGTELANAFAYASQCKTNERHEGKPIPTSVFVLTDGEAWNVSGVFANVSTAVHQAKEQNNLFRSFCLGVGDDVSTSMCEGIARAGKGVAVFVGVSVFFLKDRDPLTLSHIEQRET